MQTKSTRNMKMWCITALIIVGNLSLSQAQCTVADLYAGPITITNVTGNTFEYHFEVKNTGNATLDLKDWYFQAYVSQANFLGTGNYAAAGGSIFVGDIYGNPPAPLQPGQSFTAYWYYNPTTPVNLVQYPYVIVQILPLTTTPDCNPNNNTAVQYIGCSLAELSVENVVINNINGNTFDYTFSVKNSGWSALNLGDMYFQTYVSQDSVLNSGDKPGGGFSFVGDIYGNPPAPLQHGQSFTASAYYNPTTPEDLSVYSYLIIDVRTNTGQSVPECNTTNNTKSTLIPVETTYATMEDTDASDVLAVKQISDQCFTITSSFEYSLYYSIINLADGTVMAKGQNEVSPYGTVDLCATNLKAGAYALKVIYDKKGNKVQQFKIYVYKAVVK